MIAQEVRSGATAALREAGKQSALSLRVVKEGHGHLSKQQIQELQNKIFERSRGAAPEYSRALLDNVRLIRTAAREARDAVRGFRRCITVVDASGAETPRAAAAACAFLEAAEGSFTEEGLAAFLDGYQKQSELEMAEVWALKPALQLAHLRKIAASEPSQWPVLIASLRHASETTWKEFFESVNVVDHLLALDPAGAYVNMDYDSRESYRTSVSGLAKHSKSSEHDVAAAAVVLAQRGAQRTAHAGFYLVDKGLPALRHLIGFRAPFSTRLRDAIIDHPNAFYLVGVELITFIIVLGLLSALDAISPVVAGFLLLILPATQAAVELMNHLTTSLLRPRALPKLDFSKGIPDDCATIVAVPTLLLNEAQVANLVLDLEIRY